MEIAAGTPMVHMNSAPFRILKTIWQQKQFHCPKSLNCYHRQKIVRVSQGDFNDFKELKEFLGAMDYANEVVNDAQADIFQRVTVPFLNSLAFQMMSNQENEADDENLMKNKNQAKNEAQILMKNKDQSRNEVRILIKNEGKSQSRNEAQNWPRNWEQSRNEAQNWSRNQEQSRIEAQNWSKNWEQSRNEAQYQAINKVQNLMKNEVQDRSRNDAQNQSSNEAKTLNDLMPMLMQVLQKKPFVPDQRAFPLNQDHSIFSQQTHRPPLNDSLSWASSPSTSSNSSTRFPSFDSWSNTSFNRFVFHF